MKGIENLVENPFLLFDEKDNKISGSASCNNFFGGYATANNNLTFSQLGVTRKMCPQHDYRDNLFKSLKFCASF